MKFTPQIKALQNHINYYWEVKNSQSLFRSENIVYGYPGIRPDIILIVKGFMEYTYLGRKHRTDKGLLASHLHGPFIFDTTNLEHFVMVQFQPRSIAALLPFVSYSSVQLMENPICNLEEVFGLEVTKLELALKQCEDGEAPAILDQFFWKRLGKSHRGFLIELLFDLPYAKEIPLILKKTGYSQSTLERYVKMETGLTPKAFLNLRKYKATLEDMYFNRTSDWQYFVEKYNYTDQSHFIKTVKKYTGFTPSQLIKTPNLLAFRPNYF